MRALSIALLMVMMSACSVFQKHKADREELKAKRAEIKTEQGGSANEHTSSESEVEMAPVDPVRMVPNDSLLLSYERTPCFGRCPVFKIKVYESGYTTYQGVNFVEYMGYFYTHINAEDLNTIYQLVNEADYFSLNDSYDNENIMDLPAKIFRVDALGINKRIVARTNVPESLIQMAEGIEVLFKDTKWKAVKGDY
ncbi:MAG: DUF6438 domain-containing protein [Bacteroidetes bacterium]|nr:DUF6438 domain-containing protein [Bacteroidota bacterium]MDA0972946.1 DUF6438 domain-containing protein [Bacteroidota bacterium]